MPAPASPSPSRVLAALLALAAPALRADWRDDVGYTRLLQTYPEAISATVAGGLAQVEAGTNYMPDAANSQFALATFINKTATSTAASGHATSVGQKYYGTLSLLPGTNTVDVYGAGHWQGTGFLNFTTSSLPLVESRRVQNHSWIGTYDRQANSLATIQASVEQINRRLDYAINRDGFIGAVGMGNGASATLPDLLGQTYHTLSVGLVNGNHSAGSTVFDVAGRMKPDLVAFDTLTSYATPQVAGAAGLLSEELRALPLAAPADYPRVTKTLLLAGAAKEPLASWSRASNSTPYDATRGAGALNILLSHRILKAGAVAHSNSTIQPPTAWSSTSVGANGPNATRTYLFEIPAGSAAAPFSTALTWHRVIDNSLGAANPNLDLSLHTVAAGSTEVGAAIDSSTSAVDNVEHIYRPALAPGRYALRVTNVGGGTIAYALAWRSSPTVTIATTVASASESAPGSPAVFTVTRSGPVTSPLLVPLVWGGSAVFGTHYTAPASVLVPAGAASAAVEATPVADALAQGERTITLAVATDYSLSAGTPASADATLQDKPYDAWRHARFNAAQLADPAVSGETADPDADGLGNLLEYALGAEPLATDAPAFTPVAATDAEGRLTLTYLHAAERPDLAYAVEWTNDLSAGPGAWQTGAGVVTETARVAAEGGELVTVRADATPANAPRQFLRLRVTRL